MKRSYMRMRGSFWTGSTGRSIRALPAAERKDTRILAAYLATGPHAEVCGLYYLPVETMALETGLMQGEVERALRRLIEMGYCQYDPDTAHVWVIEMAAWQLDTPLKPADYQVVNVRRWYASCPRNAFLEGFYARYEHDLHLDVPRNGARPPRPSPFQGGAQGASEPLSTDQIRSRSPKVTVEPEGFAAFWSLYPRKDAKGAALKAWTRLAPDAALQSVIADALSHQRQSPKWLENGGEYIPHASTWLNGQRWTDRGSEVPPMTRRTARVASAVAGFLDAHREE